MLYRNIMLRPFKSLGLQEICIKLILYMIYKENTQDNSTSSNEDDEFQDCQEFHPDQDLDPPNDDMLDFINSQDHSDDQLDQVFQTYWTYTESQSSTRELNAHITYQGGQGNQAKHGSLVDRRANGGLAGSVRVLSTSPRKCTVTGIDDNEIPGLDTPIMALSTSS